MNKVQNFKKMYLISAQKWEKISRKDDSCYNNSSKSNQLNDNAFKRDDVSRFKFGEMNKNFTHSTNDSNSMTNIRVDQNENTTVKDIKIGIKNDCNAGKKITGSKANPTEEKSTQTETDYARLEDSFISCDCTDDIKEKKGVETKMTVENKPAQSSHLTLEKNRVIKGSDQENQDSVKQIDTLDKKQCLEIKKLPVHRKKGNNRTRKTSVKNAANGCLTSYRISQISKNEQDKKRRLSDVSSVTPPPKKKQRKQGAISTKKRPLQHSLYDSDPTSKKRRKISREDQYNDAKWISL